MVQLRLQYTKSVDKKVKVILYKSATDEGDIG